MPSTGIIRKLDVSGADCRLDIGYEESNSISAFYDPMIAKVVAHGTDRSNALHKLKKALQNFHISGITTNKEFLASLISLDDIVKNNIYTNFIDTEINKLRDSLASGKDLVENKYLLVFAALSSLVYTYNSTKNNSIWNEIGYWRQKTNIRLQYATKVFNIPFIKNNISGSYKFNIEKLWITGSILERKDNYYKIIVDTKQFTVWIDINRSDLTIDFEDYTYLLRRLDIPDQRYTGNSSNENIPESKEILAPLNGKIVKINVEENVSVKSGDTLLIIESMKMENRITAPNNAVIGKINVSLDELVDLKKLLITLK
jgi:3-methylcrotonyl-CoA carboxylase alpha subunit